MSLQRQMLKIASDLPVGDPKRRKILAALKAAANDIHLLVGWEEEDYDMMEWSQDGVLVQGNFPTIRAAMDAIVRKTPDLNRREWRLFKGELRNTQHVGNGKIEYAGVLSYKRRPFPVESLNKALRYLQTGR
jgi:hypothetical protein